MTDGRTDPRTFYDAYGKREWQRLDRDFFHRLEWEATIEHLGAVLPAPTDEADRPHVVDVGGGPARYAIWLGKRGYDVTLVELSETQRTLARETVADRGLDDRVQVVGGDGRSLPVGANVADAAISLGGPLSHVLDAAARETAARELRRVTVPGGPVLVSVMGLVGFLLMTVQNAAGVDDPSGLSMLPPLLSDGNYTSDLARDHGRDPAMADTHFFRRAELVSLLEDVGLTVESTVALEGVGATRRMTEGTLHEDDRRAVRTLNDRLREDPTVVDVSPHMLAICRA